MVSVLLLITKWFLMSVPSCYCVRHSFVDAYPFIQLITVVIYPSLYWILTLETVAAFVREEFHPTYGQVRYNGDFNSP